MTNVCSFPMLACSIPVLTCSVPMLLHDYDAPNQTTPAPHQHTHDAHMTQSRAQCSVKEEVHTGPGHRWNYPEMGQCSGDLFETEMQHQDRQEPQWSKSTDSE